MVVGVSGIGGVFMLFLIPAFKSCFPLIFALSIAGLGPNAQRGLKFVVA